MSDLLLRGPDGRIVNASSKYFESILQSQGFEVIEDAEGVETVPDTATASVPAPQLREDGAPVDTPEVEALPPANVPVAVEDFTDIHHVPSGSIGDVLEWVSGDVTRAQRALDAERSRDEPRRTLIDRLRPLAEG